MRFRPCIDIHNGSVKQIVGGSLADKGDFAVDNFVSEYDGAYYAQLYKKYDLHGGHIIILNPKSSPHYEADLQQAFSALGAWEGGLQIGGGINDENAAMFLDKGASHVIVTSFVFRDGQVAWENLEKLVGAVGKQHLVLFNFKCPSQFVFDADKRPISPGRIQLELETIIVDNVIVQEIDGYSGEEFFLSIMGKTDPISK